MHRRWWHGSLVVLFAAVAGAPAGAGEASATEQGRTLYLQHCARCHGADLEGQPEWQRRKADGKLPAPPHDESGHTWHHPTAQLFRITKCGLRPPLAPVGYESDMPAYDGVIADDDIAAVLDYIKGTWPPAIAGRHARIDAVSLRNGDDHACSEQK